MGHCGRHRGAAGSDFRHLASREVPRHPGVCGRRQQPARGQVDTAQFLEKGDAFAIAADENGWAVFKNPAKALRALRAHYGQGIWLIQKELHMLPLTPYTYSPYAMNGWAPTSGTAEAQEQAEFVTRFIDIYENSFQH